MLNSIPKIFRFDKAGVAFKIYAIVFLVIAGIAAMSALTLNNIWHDLQETKRNELSHLVQSAVSAVAGLDQQVKAGKLTTEQAQSRAKAMIASMRYDGKQYFWINDMQSRILMHPIKPKLIGKDMSDFKDPAGKKFFSEFVSVVKANGGGFVDYMWPKPGLEKPQPKMSYVQGYAPWGWIIGSGVYIDDLEAMYWENATQLGITAAIVLLMIVTISLLLARSLTSAIRKITEAMTRLANDQIDTEVPATDREDEIGLMAKSVLVFKENAIKKLETEQRRIERRRAEDEKRAHMDKLTADFTVNVEQIVESVSSASAQLNATAKSMTGIAKDTSNQSAAVSAASEEAATNVQTVASASEEVSVSVAEVNQQVAQASESAKGAVQEVEKTSAQVETLAATANKISDVIGIISDIADQTNLLALNATIESARAGEAGKGFAVVANEVKGLAGQTGKATEEIVQQVEEIQAATRQAVISMGEVSKIIRHVDETSASIAAAMEQQGATTQEIARNVQEAAAGTEEVSRNIIGVSQASQEAGAASGQVMSAAEDLFNQSEKLKSEVDRFVSEIRVA